MTVESALHLIKGSAHEVGQLVGTMAQSPRADWRRLVSLGRQIKSKFAIYLDLPGDHFKEMFTTRTADEVCTLHAQLVESCRDLIILRDKVEKIAKKKMSEVESE